MQHSMSKMWERGLRSAIHTIARVKNDAGETKTMSYLCGAKRLELAGSLTWGDSSSVRGWRFGFFRSGLGFPGDEVADWGPFPPFRGWCVGLAVAGDEWVLVLGMSFILKGSCVSFVQRVGVVGRHVCDLIMEFNVIMYCTVVRYWLAVCRARWKSSAGESQAIRPLYFPQRELRFGWSIFQALPVWGSGLFFCNLFCNIRNYYPKERLWDQVAPLRPHSIIIIGTRFCPTSLTSSEAYGLNHAQ